MPDLAQCLIFCDFGLMSLAALLLPGLALASGHGGPDLCLFYIRPSARGPAENGRAMACAAWTEGGEILIGPSAGFYSLLKPHRTAFTLSRRRMPRSRHSPIR